MSKEGSRKANAWHPTIFGGIFGASSTTTAHLLFCHEPNMVNLSAAALTAVIAILSACETCNLASRQNDIINKLYDRNKQH